MTEELNLDQLIDQALSQIRSKPKETEKLYVVDVTIGRTVGKLWTLNKRTGIVVPLDSKVQTIVELLGQGKIVVVEVEKDTLVQRRNIVKVHGGIEIPDEKMIHVMIEPDRNGIKLTGDGVLLRPDPFSFNTQRLIEKYEEGTTEILVLPVCCDNMGRCYGIQWKPLKIEKYIPQEYTVEKEKSVEDLIENQKEAIKGEEEGFRISLRKKDSQ